MARHLRSGADVDPASLRGRRQGLGQRPRATSREHGRARRSPVGAGGIVQEHGRRAGGPRAHRGEQRASGGERPADGFLLEDLLHQVGDRHRQRTDRLAAGLGAEVAEGLAQLQPHEGVGDRGRARVGRGGHVDVGEEARDRPHLLVELDERVGVVRVPIPQLARGAARVAPEGHGRAIGLRREQPHIGRDRLEPVLLQLQVLHDGGSQPPDRVRDAGRGEALGHGGVPQDAPDLGSGLQHRDLLAALREVGGGHQAVVAGADDDDVLSCSHQSLPLRCFSDIRPPSVHACVA